MSVTLTDYRSIIRDNASLFHLSKDPSYRKVYLDNIINHSEHLVPWEELSTIEKQLKNSATIIRLIQEYICECSDEHGIFKGPGIIKITLEREAFEQREFIVDLIKTYYS